MAHCPDCAGEAFRVEDADGECVLACASCGRALGAAPGAGLAELGREIQLVREELARLRQAVNFLNQRVR
jgi:hypothetical protein